MRNPIKMLLLYVNESDTWHDVPLHHAIVHRLMQLGVAGATSHAGLIGYGHHHHVHHKGLFGIADDRPIAIVAIDREDKLRAAAPRVKEMVKEGLIVLLDAELLHESSD